MSEDLSTQINYLYQISHTFERFKQKSPYLWNVRCPFCGDSAKSKYKMRGYVGLDNKTSLLAYTCHNCDDSRSFRSLLQHQSVSAYEQYVLESFKNKKTKIIKVSSSSALDDLFGKNDSRIGQFPTIDRLSLSNPLRQYLTNRKIPTRFFPYLYGCDSFGEWVDSVSVDDKGKYPQHQKRILIPFFDRHKKLVAVQGRSIDPIRDRYATIKFTDDMKLFGADRLDTSKTIFVVEGPFDSMFIANAVATADSNLANRNLVSTLECTQDQLVLIFDNQPRNLAVVRKLERAIEQHFNVLIWPSSIHQKDINDMVLDDVNVKQIIEQNVMSGLQAKLKFIQWKKI